MHKRIKDLSDDTWDGIAAVLIIALIVSGLSVWLYFN